MSAAFSRLPFIFIRSCGTTKLFCFLKNEPCEESAWTRRFFVGCHSAAISGAWTERRLSSLTYLCEQKGHPAPPFARSVMSVRQTCFLLRRHCHHAFFREPHATSSGLSVFFSCHSRTRSGRQAATELDLSTFFPAQ